MSRQPLDLLSHIRDELEFLKSESEALSEDLFQRDGESQEGVRQKFRDHWRGFEELLVRIQKFAP